MGVREFLFFLFFFVLCFFCEGRARNLWRFEVVVGSDRKEQEQKLVKGKGKEKRRKRAAASGVVKLELRG